jgi:hypothetical protein
MLRRRLLSIVGTVGLLAAVLSSGIGAQAASAPGPDATYNSLLATYQYSSQNTWVRPTSRTSLQRAEA